MPECDIYIRAEVDRLKRENRELHERLRELVHENAKLNEMLCRKTWRHEEDYTWMTD